MALAGLGIASDAQAEAIELDFGGVGVEGNGAALGGVELVRGCDVCSDKSE